MITYYPHTLQIQHLNSKDYLIFDCLIFEILDKLVNLFLLIDEIKQYKLIGKVLINRSVEIVTENDHIIEIKTVIDSKQISPVNLKQIDQKPVNSYHRDLISKESYAHSYAKDCVRNWLTAKWHQALYYQKNEAVFGHLNWKVNVGHSGIYLEYPILKFNNQYQGLTAWSTYPNLKSAVQNGREIYVIFDLIIVSDGKIKYGIEINYKHSVSDLKKQKIKELGIPYYELSALWVLDQICIPSKIVWEE